MRSILLSWLLMAPLAAGASDVLLKNATVYDGTGGKAVRADVRVQGDRIVKVSPLLQPLKGEKVRDLHGLALAPGFIDMHSHADELILEDRDAENTVRQGITTAVVGQDGGSAFPLADFLAKVEKTPPSINIASMVGHGTLRRQGMAPGNQLRPATPEELAKMKELLARELKAGAFGLSSGLEYDPGHFATTEELIELSELAAATGGFYISHVRDEGDGALTSFRELVEIGKGGGLPAEITHIKLASTAVWHKYPEVDALFAQAQKQGVRLWADVYPYTFWQSNIRVIILDRDYYNPKTVAKALADNGGPDRIYFTAYKKNPALVGKTLAQVARLWGVSPIDAYIRAVKETAPNPDEKPEDEATIMAEAMHEDDVKAFIADPRVTFCSDGGLHDLHPRGAGSFPRILGKYVREEKVLTLEQAIRKMTGLPAEHLGLADRGTIAEGKVADLVIFNPATVLDGSSIAQPMAPPKGIEAVMVGGEWVVEGNQMTGAHPGKVLRRAMK